VLDAIAGGVWVACHWQITPASLDQACQHAHTAGAPYMTTFQVFRGKAGRHQSAPATATATATGKAVPSAPLHSSTTERMLCASATHAQYTWH